MRKGFTIIELLLVIALMAVASVIAIPAYIDFQSRNDIDTAEVTFAQSVRRAQQLSMAVDSDTNWGVIAQSGQITIYKGSSYVSRDVNFDENFDLSSAITPSGTTEYNFSKVFGVPGSAGTVTFTGNNSEQRTVNVNAKGVVNY